ncbi:hypothetical protein SELMODRAFT_77297, partial [Selaginella moellendorffii]
KPASVKLLLNGGEKITFPLKNGYFAFQGIPAGTHLIEVSAPGFFFSPLRVDVSARLHGQVRASRSRPEEFSPKREPFSVLGLLKSPMGLMVAFMLIAVVVLPKLMDNIDPEEMKKIQEEMRNRPSPSFSNLLQGARS